MRRSSLLVVAVVIAAGCGASQKGPKSGLSPREIIDTSSPAIVRIEAGDSKVGTGFILDENGLIATNLHVIEGESKVRVKLYKDNTEYPATVVAAVDKNHDLALIRIQPRKRLPKLRLGDSSAVSAGDRVYAIGNPLGVFDYSITDGLISQVRPLSDDLTILQISAAISQGSSGGPLFNQYGEVIGVTTAIITQGQAINLAVPANYLRPLMQRPIAMSFDDFAKATKDSESPEAEQDIPIHRVIPDHPITIWNGCSEKDMEEVLRSVGDAIAIGAPLYNRNTPEGYEACFRVYEGTALKYEKDAPCKGVHAAFGDGLLRAQSLGSFKEKAWALRDTFDGLIKAFEKWCKQDKACMKKFGPPDASVSAPLDSNPAK
ncbi:MAG TPA: S1C family serine protease [Kofleriaceae bacterium]|nr:S1C family serine protease [Kofleriaceae bacterium]